MRVKLSRCRWRFVAPGVVLGVVLGGILANAQTKPIRLRTETIATPPKAISSLQPQAVDVAASGLFLVQFTDRFQPAWREQLQTMGVELLRYVPDDAFIARFDNVQPGYVRSLSFVRWVGPYRPEHKIHPALRTAEQTPVGVLLSPKASAKDAVIARRTLRKFARQTQSRFGTVLRGEVGPAQLTALANSDAVLWIEPAPKMNLFDEISSKIVGGDDGEAGTRTTTQQLGFDGTGVTVAVADSGLHHGDAATMHPDLAGRVDAFFFYGSLIDAADEHSHGTHVTGIIAGDAALGETDESGYLYGLGVAPEAHIVAQRLFDGAGNYEPPPSFETLTRDAVRAGADIGSNSWGDDTQGRYDLSAAEFDALVRDADAQTPGDQPYTLEFSAGNAGPGAQTIGSPAVAKNVIATGAAQNNRFDFFIYAEGQETMADFSSRGPCEDGRIKPDVAAPGTWIASLQSASATDENAWLAISENYQYQGGTSQSGPHVSGAAALFVQYYRETHTNAPPSPALVKAALINSAVDMDESFGTDRVPNNEEGWGRVDLAELIGSPRRYEFIDQAHLVRGGQTEEYRVVAASSDEPLKITLVYTDVPGFPAAIPALVNDLDLEVEAPNGSIYRGNQFDNGESVPNAPSHDPVNNVEAVNILVPAPGEYIVRVHANNVVEDARRDTPEIDQDFALVASGDLLLPGVGIVFFNRGAYRVPDQIGVKVIDLDLGGQSSLNVLLTSSTETNGETITLFASGAGGVFTNGVVTAGGAAVADGSLQMAHGDTIRAEYRDLSASETRMTAAVADFVPPALSNVVARNRFGRMAIFWTTDERATGIVRYGTNSNLSATATNTILALTREVTLDGLIAGVTYQFIVISTDEAGNTATNDNGGALFSFVAQPAKTVLLVDAYVHGPDDESIEIPVTQYTDTLDQTGVSYDVWDVEQGGSPTLNDLRPFRIVIWRINDSFYDTTFISTAEQTALRSYLDGGGAFFMASMEIISRLLNNGGDSFVTNVLRVGQFIRNTDPFGECDDCDEDRGVPSLQGVGNDPISNGVDVTLDYSAYPFIDLEPLGIPNIGPDLGDTFRPRTNAAAILTEPFSGRACGIRYPRTGEDSASRVVFFAFPLDAVPTSGDAPNRRADLLRNVLRFLSPGIGGAGTIALDRAAYTVSSVVTMEVADSDLAELGQTTVLVSSDTETNGQTVTITATPRPGLFRGSIVLTPAASAFAPGQLRAQNGDQIRAEYLDASASRVVRAAAVVDTVPAVISGVTALPDYESAEVAWDTSKPTDGLLQFWETTAGFPRNRIAYDSDLTESHSLLLQGLQPDQSYFFQVVVRDAAGNTTVDDNGGQFYSFRTLRPIRPPWFDDLEMGGTNWVVFDAEGSQATWRLGVPNNGVETVAHSPANAWGSNLDGAPLDTASTFLISPAIELIGGNVATLRFWHSYDFTERSEFDLYEIGRLLLFTNSVSEPLVLEEYGDLSLGWEEAEFDLTPYAGRVIFLVWDYELFSFDFFETHARPAWLIDDVSVTVSNVVRGTIVVTNNLSQARFTLSGPVSLTNQGWGLILTNVPLGEYVVTYNAVPFYQTPPAQTNLVLSATPVVFQGNYTFADGNSNGMSDAWEQQVFGSVAPDRTQTTDTDVDGQTDYAEFIAGTDATSANSALEVATPVVQPNNSLKLNWASVPGRAYRLQASTDLITWAALTEWVRAASATSSIVLPPQTGGVNYFYRLEVRP